MGCRKKDLLCSKTVKTKKITYGPNGKKVVCVTKKIAAPKTILYNEKRTVACGLDGGIPCTPCFKCVGRCAARKPQ